MSRTASVGFVTTMGQPMATSQDFVNWVCGPELDPAYLQKALIASRPQILALCSGSTHKTMYVRDAERLRVLLPPIEEQRRIAAVLDAADVLRAKRRQALAKLDTLTQAIFIDIFGDPAVNPQGLREVPLVELAEGKDGVKCGPFGTQLAHSEYRTAGVPLWGIPQVNRHFRTKTIEFLEPAKASELESFSIRPGDIVMTRKGTVGNCAVYPAGFPDGIMHSDLLRVRPSAEVDPLFLSDQLTISRAVQEQIRVMSGGAVMPGINVTKLKKLVVLAPSSASQLKYGDLVRDRLRLREDLVQQQLQVDTLFASLQQRAFRGEL